MIAKRGVNFWLDIWVGKKRVRRSLKTDERALAIERARDITVDLRTPRPAGAPITEFFGKYLEWSKQTKPSTYRMEKYQAGVIKPWLENAGLLTLDQIMPHHVEQVRAYVMTRTVGHTARTIGRSTANRYLAMLRTMFHKATDWGLYSGVNPVSRVKFYREGGKVRPLSEDEIGRVIEAAWAIGSSKHTSPMGRAIYDICLLVLNTGLRRSEALNLRWSDIIDDTLRVHGKGDKVRMIPLNAEARAILKRQPRDGVYIYAIPNRNAAGVLRRVTETITRKTKVPFHLHLLRHAFASRLLAAGVDVVTISNLMGHSAFMTTLLYSHSNPRLMRQAIDALPGHRHADFGPDFGASS